MPTLSLPADLPWHQYDYWNCPEDILTNHSSGERRKIWKGRVNQKGLKKYSASERTTIVEDWKNWRDENGNFDSQCGKDACGPTALGMVLRVLNVDVTHRRLCHGKHVLASWAEGDPEEGKAWTKMEHAFNVGSHPDGTVSGKSYLRIDSASPTKLMLMAQHLIGDKADEFEWINKGTGGFADSSEAFVFLKECIDNGHPLIVSYKLGPCTKIGNKLQGSGGHYVVVVGYDLDDSTITMLDPACGSLETVKQSKVLASPERFKKWSGGSYQNCSQNYDGGFMAAWGRKSYRYLLIKPLDGSGAAAVSGPTVSAPAESVESGASSDDVPSTELVLDEPKTALARIQFRLKRMKKKDGTGPYYTKKVDGKYGDGTKAAVKAFQGDHGLTVDGIPGKDTAGKINEVWKAWLAAEATRRNPPPSPAPPPPKPKPQIVRGMWSTGLATLGMTVKVMIETEGIDDGTAVTVYIMERDKYDKDDFIKLVQGTVSDDSCTIDVTLDRSDQEWGEFHKNEFYFIAEAAGQATKFETILDVVV